MNGNLSQAVDAVDLHIKLTLYLYRIRVNKYKIIEIISSN